MLITKEMLIEKGAGICKYQVELFEKIFPDGAIFPDDLEKAGKAGLDTAWAFVNFKLTGEYKYWGSVTGILRTHCFFKDGKLDGKYKHWSSDGVLQTHCFLKEGKLIGEYKYWSSDGVLLTHCFLQRGER